MSLLAISNCSIYHRGHLHPFLEKYLFERKICHFLALKSKGGFEKWKNIDKNGILKQKVQYFNSSLFISFKKKNIVCIICTILGFLDIDTKNCSDKSIRGKMLENCIEKERKVLCTHLTSKLSLKTNFNNMCRSPLRDGIRVQTAYSYSIIIG